MQTTIKINNGITRMEQWRLAKPVDFEIKAGEQIAITGPNGGGKSLLVEMITGAHPLVMQQPEYNFGCSSKEYAADKIKYISFEDAYGASGSNYYLQKRWNMHDIDDDTPTVRMSINKEISLINDKSTMFEDFKEKLFNIFDIKPMLDKYVISLSSGELRKLHLAKNLLSAPRILILDNPFIGLDKQTRNVLTATLTTLINEMGIQIILVQPDSSNIPAFITHIVEVSNLIVHKKMSAEEFYGKSENEIAARSRSNASSTDRTPALPEEQDDENTPSTIVEMRNITIRYGKRTIIKDFSWTVRNGERWAVNGENGAGKSTLLSLICADNPQSYACDINLFGRSRGTGESIWEIKKHIGYVSPEMHRAYKRNIPVMRIIASGLKDSVGLYVQPTNEEEEKCYEWMRVFGISELKDRMFLTLSSGEQRMVLLARAFVKDPQLLILDEPFHGLDISNKEKCRQIIDAFAKRKNKTIIMVSHYEEEYPECINHKLTLRKSR